MALPKLTDKMKVERAKANVMRSLQEIKENRNRAEVLGFVTGQLAHLYALLDADKVDEMGIVYVAVSIMDELDPKERKPIIGGLSATQLRLVEE